MRHKVSGSLAPQSVEVIVTPSEQIVILAIRTSSKYPMKGILLYIFMFSGMLEADCVGGPLLRTSLIVTYEKSGKREKRTTFSDCFRLHTPLPPPMQRGVARLWCHC